VSPERVPETLIVGGGIGGLSAALCLARRGGAVTVLERSKSFAEVGAGIQLAPNATRILQRLHLARPHRLSGALRRALPRAANRALPY